ncbi:MAG: thioredoxin domain-containing protein [Bacteroidetes bacterium]|nr:thioredoxin domain-containing protein [Bacteroidota bacterium]
MIKQLYILLTTVFIFSCSNGQNQQAAENSGQPQNVVEKVNAEKFKQLVESGEGIILDVRTPEEVNQGYINGASVINFYDEDFESKINLMQKDKPVYVYCKAGGRSSQAAELMKKNGFKKVYNLEGGMNAWMGNNFAVTKPEGVKDENIKQLTLAEFQQMLKTSQPVLVDFHTKWCAPCRKMVPVVEKISTDFKGKATVLRLDVDNSKEVAKQYEIQGVPVFILFKNGVQKWKKNGIVAEEELAKAITENLK